MPRQHLSATLRSWKILQVAGGERPLAEAASVGVVVAGGTAEIFCALILNICRMSYFLVSERLAVFFWQRKRQMLISADPATCLEKDMFLFICRKRQMLISADSATASDIGCSAAEAGRS